MKIELQENDIEIVNLGPSTSDHGVVKRDVTFEINGKTFTREIILAPNGTGDDYTDPENFYRMNKEQVDANLILFLSEHHLYDNQ